MSGFGILSNVDCLGSTTHLLHKDDQILHHIVWISPNYMTKLCYMKSDVGLKKKNEKTLNHPGVIFPNRGLIGGPNVTLLSARFVIVCIVS